MSGRPASVRCERSISLFSSARSSARMSHPGLCCFHESRQSLTTSGAFSKPCVQSSQIVLFWIERTSVLFEACSTRYSCRLLWAVGYHETCRVPNPDVEGELQQVRLVLPSPRMAWVRLRAGS